MVWANSELVTAVATIAGMIFGIVLVIVAINLSNFLMK